MSTHDIRMTAIPRRQALRAAAGIGLGAFAAPYLGRSSAIAQDVTCPPAATPAANTGTPEPMSGKKIGVSVAYLSVPFYANFKTGLADGAKRFGFDYDLRDGGGGDLSVEVGNL